jgi:hypothetical protein
MRVCLDVQDVIVSMVGQPCKAEKHHPKISMSTPIQPLLSPIRNQQTLPNMAVLGKRKARSEPSISKEDAAAIFRRHFEAQFAPLPGADVESKSKATKRDNEDEDGTSVDSDEEDDDEEEGSDDDNEWGGLSDDEQSEEEEGESRKAAMATDG